MADWNLRLILNRIWGERPVGVSLVGRAALAEPARAGVLAAVRRRRARRRSAVVRRAARAAARGGMSTRPKPASPYKGLNAFEDSELDALLFFGRERETEIVVANLIASRLTVLYGPSGVGKSSLLARGRRTVAARAARGAARRRLLELERRSERRALSEAVGEAAGVSTNGSAVAALELAQAGARRLPRARPGGGVLPLPRRRRADRPRSRRPSRRCSPHRRA